MKLFGLNIEMEKKNYWISNFHSPVSGIFDNGQELKINMQTFYKMYRIDSDIRACIEELMQTAGKGGWQVRRWINNRKDYKPIDNAQVNEVLMGMKYDTLKSELVKHISISGNAFILREQNIEDSNIGFKVLDTRGITIVTDSKMNVLRYFYKDSKINILQTYQPEDVYHYIDTIDPDNTAFGISKLETIVYDVMGDNEASKSNYYFFQNDALPSSMYILQEGLTAENQEKVINDLKNQLQGGKNKHKNVASGNIIDIKPIAQTHTDMDFINQKKHKTEKVCATLSVPRILLNYTEGVNYSNAEMQYKKFIENTIRPWETVIQNIINILLEKELGGDEFTVIDTHINDLETKLALAILGVQNGLLTRNEGREFMGYEKDTSDEMMDEYTVWSGTILLDTVSSTPVEVEVPTQPAKTLGVKNVYFPFGVTEGWITPNGGGSVVKTQ